jgi:soluble lytic murein transglycosylase-like protein
MRIILLLLLATTPAFGRVNCARFDVHRCDRFDAEFAAASQMFGLPAKLYKAIAWTESRCKTGARSRVGAMGVMQLMPNTFAFLQPYTDAIDPWDPLDSIVTGSFYLTHLIERYGGPHSAGAWLHGIVAYNGGPGAVPSAPSPAGDDWDKFSAPSTHYADQVLTAFFCLGGQSPQAL